MPSPPARLNSAGSLTRSTHFRNIPFFIESFFKQKKMATSATFLYSTLLYLHIQHLVSFVISIHILMRPLFSFEILEQISRNQRLDYFSLVSLMLLTCKNEYSSRQQTQLSAPVNFTSESFFYVSIFDSHCFSVPRQSFQNPVLLNVSFNFTKVCINSIIDKPTIHRENQ